MLSQVALRIVRSVVRYSTKARPREALVKAGLASASNEEAVGQTAQLSKNYLPALDGVRAIAILLVVLYHALDGLPSFTWGQRLFIRVASQGWIGVDLFFVLSGFLITGILLDGERTQKSLRNFYARRILRIVPVYAVFLLYSLWLAPRFGTSSSDEAALLGKTQVWYWTYTVNFLVALRNWSAITRPTGHLWSLSVEEQFYLLWPIAVLALSTRSLKWAALGCIVGAELVRFVLLLAGASGQVGFVLLPSRMDALAAGALLACAYRDRSLWSRVLRARQVAVLGALALLLLVVLRRHTIDIMESDEQLLVLPALVALGGVLVASGAEGLAGLAGAALRFIAQISYGMYVWHLVALRLVSARVHAPPETADAWRWWVFYGAMVTGTLGITIVLAQISWHFIERPVLRLKRYVPAQ